MIPALFVIGLLILLDLWLSVTVRRQTRELERLTGVIEMQQDLNEKLMRRSQNNTRLKYYRELDR